MMDNNEWIDINPEYVYMKIPADYVCLYHKLLILFADFGIELIKDCKASCNKTNSKIIDCFNMFNAAVASRQLNKNKEAEILIKYINAQIDLIYKNKDNSPSIVFPVDEDGNLKAVVGCGSNPRFQINITNGELYKGEFLNKCKSEDIYGLDEHDINSE